jgi:hypothetical protein
MRLFWYFINGYASHQPDGAQFVCTYFGPGAITVLTKAIHSSVHLVKVFEFVRFEALEP